MKILLTATVQSHICQFHKPLVEILHEQGYEVHVAARDNLAEKNGLKLDFAEKVFDLPFSRSPKSADNIRAYRQLKKIIEQEQYDIIHCNTPMGGIVTRLAAKSARKQGTKVYYTAHGFHFYKGAPVKNWIVFYTIEKYFSRYCDKILTINFEDYDIAAKKFKCDAYHIHGAGVDEKRYRLVTDDERQALRKRFGLKEDDFAILCVGELLPNKNQKMVIEAVGLLKQKGINVKLLLAGNGREKQELERIIAERGLAENVTLLGYCTNLEEYQRAVNLGVSCSIREGLGFNMIEAMLSGNPVIATKNRGHNELITEGKNGFLVDIGDVKDLADKIEILFKNPEMCVELSKNGLEIAKEYTQMNVKKELKDIYSR